MATVLRWCQKNKRHRDRVYSELFDFLTGPTPKLRAVCIPHSFCDTGSKDDGEDIRYNYNFTVQFQASLVRV